MHFEHPHVLIFAALLDQSDFAKVLKNIYIWNKPFIYIRKRLQVSLKQILHI